MPTLTLEGANGDSLNLHQIGIDGQGFEAQPGLTGLGLPPVTLQWAQGAGDGAVYRGKRVSQRTIDIPLELHMDNPAAVQLWMSRLAMILDDVATLRLIDDAGQQWTCEVVRSGGGDYAYGVDTRGNGDLSTVITLMAGDPFWTLDTDTVLTTEIARIDFLGNFGKMAISKVVQLRDMQLMNSIGDATAYPVWTVKGPGRDFTAVNTRGEKFEWTGTLAIGETLTIDTKTGAVIDNHNVNRYADMAPGPQLWTIPPGTTVATASLLDTDNGSAITCKFRPRRQLIL